MSKRSFKYNNDFHIPITRVRELFETRVGQGWERVNNPIAKELNHILYHFAPDYKLIHPLFIGKYARISKHHKDEPARLIGFDIETRHTTGEPKLFGFHYPNGTYFHLTDPTLETFYRVVGNVMDNSPDTHFVTWGNLDLQEVLRVFQPDTPEQHFIGRGYSGSFDKYRGQWIAVPPCSRIMSDGNEFFIDHYVKGRSLRIGIVRYGQEKAHAKSIWIFNISQFYPATIAQTATSLGLNWKEFSKDTHLIDWERFETDSEYRKECLDSNAQDARIVVDLADNLGKLFYEVFEAYPSLLVSTGSLADAAVSKLLPSEADYGSNSWRWISQHNPNFTSQPEIVREAETLLAEAFSAGYVDQFAVGYFPEAHVADISSAYPAIIRHLPDLRDCELFKGTGNPSTQISILKRQGYQIFTAVIRGKVSIPETLKYHPITIKTHTRQNIRAQGTFRAAYYIEEREFCARNGASFSDEEFVIFAFKTVKLAPIAKISRNFESLRNEYRKKMESVDKTSSEYQFFDGMQLMIKVVDNSLYGKTVMTIPIVENVDDKVEITGLRGGDRFNLLYGGVITSRTRIQLAEACMQIERNGGTPLLAMTDSVYWAGSQTNLPDRMHRPTKVAGYFEAPDTVFDFFLLKSGQYEYRQGTHWEHKMRGLNLPFDRRDDTESFFRKTLKEFCKDISEWTHPQDIQIPLPVRRLVTIGAYDIERLGLVEDNETKLKPFVLSGKNTQRYIFDWPQVLDGYVMLKHQIIVNGDDSPLAYLRELYEQGKEHLTKYERKQLFYWECILRIAQKGDPVEMEKIQLKKRLTEHSWKELEDWFGVTREAMGI